MSLCYLPRGICVYKIYALHKKYPACQQSWLTTWRHSLVDTPYLTASYGEKILPIPVNIHQMCLKFLIDNNPLIMHIVTHLITDYFIGNVLNLLTSLVGQPLDAAMYVTQNPPLRVSCKLPIWHHKSLLKSVHTNRSLISYQIHYLILLNQGHLLRQ